MTCNFRYLYFHNWSELLNLIQYKQGHNMLHFKNYLVISQFLVLCNLWSFKQPSTLHGVCHTHALTRGNIGRRCGLRNVNKGKLVIDCI